jgi:hypothetical protein
LRSATGLSLAKSNGKRPIQTISDGDDEEEDGTSIGSDASSKPSSFPTETHPSGYTWTEREQEPGYAWTSEKAQDEYKRAADQMVHKESAVKAEYGDIFEVVEREKAILASMKQVNICSQSCPTPGHPKEVKSRTDARAAVNRTNTRCGSV